MGIFNKHAQRIWEHGLSIIPVDGKRPIIKGWQVFSDRLPSEAEISEWLEKYPNANIGIVMGKASNLISIDIDSVDEKIQQLVQEYLPPTPSAKKGQKAPSYFYKFSGQVSSEIKYKSLHIGDILSTGRQTVIPPSIHPETNEAYTWIGKPVWECLDDLPEISNEALSLFMSSIRNLDIKPEDKKDFSSGRNNTHKVFVSRLAELRPEKEIAQMLVERDKLLFKENPLFSDRSEMKSDDPFVNAYDFVTNITKSIIGKKKSRGEKVKEETKSKPEYPTKQNGFFLQYEDENGRIKEKPQYKELAKYLRDEVHYKHNDSIDYIYEDGKYIPVGPSVLNNMILNLTLEKATANQVQSFRKEAEIYCYFDFDKHKKTAGLINLNNGVLNIKESKLSPHSPDYFFKYKLPHNFDPSAVCPRFNSYLFHCTEDDKTIDLIFEIFGYVLEGHGQSKQKAFCFTGAGGTGKGTTLEILKALIGPENYASVDLDKIDNDFHCVKLDGKILNVTGELPDRAINASKFKTITSYEHINVSEKNRPVYSIRVDAKFVFSANGLPTFSSGSNMDALLRRLIFIPFDKKVEGEVMDDFYMNFLDEMSGVLNQALKGLARLKANNKFSKSSKADDLYKDFISTNDSVSEFFEEVAEFVGDYDRNKVNARKFFLSYVSHCKINGRRNTSYREFVKRSKTYLDAKKISMNLSEAMYYYPANKLTFRGFSYDDFLGNL